MPADPLTTKRKRRILRVEVSTDLLRRLQQAVARDRKRIQDGWTRSDAVREALTTYLAGKDLGG